MIDEEIKQYLPLESKLNFNKIRMLETLQRVTPSMVYLVFKGLRGGTRGTCIYEERYQVSNLNANNHQDQTLLPVFKGPMLIY